MRTGIVLTVGDPREAADLAALAEAAGWDGAFTWDGVAIGPQDTYDPWVLLAAVAMRTERVRLGAIVTPPARRRPWKLARETMTLDRLSGGRLILAVGLGALDDAAFGSVGEPTDPRTRAERLDESLAILEGLWSGAPFSFSGRHFRFDPLTFRPPPVQQPRIPVWVVGAWPSPRSLARAARWDGIVAQARGADGTSAAPTPAQLAEIVAWVERERDTAGLAGPYDVVAQGTTPGDDPAAARAIVASFAAAGATWWIEADWSTTVPGLRRRIAAGPPRT